MTERIDHVFEAREWMHNGQHNEETVEQASLSLGFAQVHATLALAEQQRIANIIALSQVTIVPGHMPVFRDVVFDPSSGQTLHPEIRKVLGL